MKIHPNSVVVFPAHLFDDKPTLRKYVVTRLKIRKNNTVGVLSEYVKEVCKVLKIPQTQLLSRPTIYKGVYMATLKEKIAVPKVRDRRAAMRRKYMEIATGPKINKAQRLKQAIHNQEVAIDKVQVDLVSRLRNLETLVQEYQMVDVVTPESLENKGIEFDKLMANPDIVDISIKSGCIEVFTVPLDIVHGKHVYDIGRFKINLEINPTRYIVRFYNLTRVVEGCYHPHVYSNGQPCLGNIQECLPHMVANRQFAAAISVCIQYLRSVNEGGHYCPITKWPLKKAEEKRGNEKRVSK